MPTQRLGESMTEEDPNIGKPSNLDEAFSTLPRLKIAAFLSGCDQAEFKTVATATETPPSVLSKAMSKLEQAQYLDVNKGHVGRRPRTWLSLTASGRIAFSRHLEELNRLTQLAPNPTASHEQTNQGAPRHVMNS